MAAALSAGDHAAARAALPTMVHREAEATEDGDLAALAVDAIAEESIDGVVAPAMWAAVAGAPGTLAYRGINSLDALVGHHTERHDQAGLAGDAVDVAANLVPAYLAAALVATVAGLAPRATCGRPCASTPGAIRRAASAPSRPPSPRPLGLRPGDGGGRAATPDDVTAAVSLSRDISLAMGTSCLALGGAATIAARWKARE